TAPWRPPARVLAAKQKSIQSQLEDVALVGLEIALLDPLDDVGERRVRRRRYAEFLALADHDAVEKLDFGAPALDHVLAHGRPVRAAAGLLGLGEAVVVVGALGSDVAFAVARDDLRIG